MQLDGREVDERDHEISWPAFRIVFSETKLHAFVSARVVSARVVSAPGPSFGEGPFSDTSYAATRRPKLCKGESKSFFQESLVRFMVPSFRRKSEQVREAGRSFLSGHLTAIPGEQKAPAKMVNVRAACSCVQDEDEDDPPTRLVIPTENPGNGNLTTSYRQHRQAEGRASSRR